ncbi:hypothetical protein ACIFOT_13145 [Neobacillus sp. NRS-1170]|uniref:hypothetical protein n=1 Tax=Neobacillus sp. NRS-1170 TaxID=3233898 RepID=UPI003D26E20F
MKNILTIGLIIVSIFFLAVGIYEGIKNQKLTASLEEKEKTIAEEKKEIKQAKKETQAKTEELTKFVTQQKIKDEQRKQQHEDDTMGDLLWKMVDDAKVEVTKTDSTYKKTYTMKNTSGKKISSFSLYYDVFDKNGAKIAKSLVQLYNEPIAFNETFTMTIDVSLIGGREIQLMYLDWTYPDSDDSVVGDDGDIKN